MCKYFDMELAGERVLNDCRLALNLLKDAEKSHDSDLIRLHWLTCVVLLRSVGHVLDKVDRAEFDLSRQAKFSEYHKSRSKDSIFKEFIEKERNLAIKEYKFLYAEKKIEELQQDYLLLQDGMPLLLQNNDELVVSEMQKIKLIFIKDNFFDEHELLSDIIKTTINWWETYLKELKLQLTAPNNG